MTFSTALGGTTTVTLANVSTRPQGCNIRPLFVSAEVASGYIPALANDAGPGYSTPAALDVQIYSPTGIVATSRPTVLGAQPRRVWARYPKSGDWFSADSITSTKLARLTAICLGNPGKAVTGYLRGVIHIRYQFSYEILTGTCPSLTHLLTDVPIPRSVSSWWEEVERDQLPPSPGGSQSSVRRLNA